MNGRADGQTDGQTDGPSREKYIPYFSLSGYKTAAQLMDQYKGEKKGQCNGNDEAFKKWIICCFGYWNTQYAKVG